MKSVLVRSFGAGLLAGVCVRSALAGVPVGQSGIIGDVMWSDTFTVGERCASGYHGSTVSSTQTRVDAAYMVERAVGATQWRRTRDFSFNTPADAVAQYAGNSAGNDGAATGFAQSGGGLLSFRGIFPSRVAFQMDARTTSASVNIATYSAELPDTATSFQIRFYGTGAIKLAAYGGAEIDTGLTTGISSLNDRWHNYAVIFDRTAQCVEVFVDEVKRGTVDVAALGAAMKADDPCIGMACPKLIWYDNVQVGVPTTGSNDLALEAWRTERMDVSSTTRRVPALADGTIVKTGAGTLDLGGAAIARGTLDVREGAVAVDATDPGLPMSLQSGLAFWVDANVNVTASGGKVTEWRDRREAAGGRTYPRAVAHGTGEEPTLVDGTGAASGLKLVDFGTFGQSDAGWLRWEDADGNRCAVDVVTAIYVLACPNGGGCVIGDWDGASDDVHTGSTEWNPDILPETTSPTGSLSPNASFYAYVDDVARNAAGVAFVAETTVYAFNKGGLAYPCSTFFNDRNLRQGDAGDTNGTPCAVSHQGGGRLAEALLFTRELHETEYRMIGAYLLRKWKGGTSVGNVRLAGGSSLHVAADAVRPPVLCTLTGAGRVAVAGTAGSVRLAAGLEPRVTTPFDVPPGTSLEADADSRVGAFPVDVRTGRSYAVSPSGVVASVCGDAACAEKTGDGTLVALSLPTGTVRVAAGALRLTGPEDAEEATNVIANADFERITTFAPAASLVDTLTWGYNSVVPDWTLGSLSGVNATGVSSCPGTRLTSTYKTSSGQTVLFVQVDGYAETTFALPARGWYRLDFTAFKRNLSSSPFGLLDVLVDGVSVGRIQINRTDPRTFAMRFPSPLAAGAHTLRFQGVLAPNATNPDANYDTMALIDDIRVTEDQSRLGENLVVNGGFETHDTLATGYPRPYQYAPTGSGWTFVDPDQPSVTNAGITQAENAWIDYQAYEGSCMAFLRQNGYFAQDITFPEPGRYRLSFVIRGRFVSKHWLYAGQIFKVFLDGTQVAYLQGSPWEPERVTVELPEIEPGHLVRRLSFRGQSTVDRATLFDDIRVEKLPDGLANPGFEWSGAFANGNWEAGIQGAGWSFDVGSGQLNQSGICTRSGPWAKNSGVPFGVCCAFIQMRGRVAQTVTVPTSGVYRVSFSARRRASAYANHDFRVVCGGMALGSVTTRGPDDWKRYSFRTPFLKAGVPFELAFEGLNQGDNVDRASVIDEVAIERVADGAAPGTDAFAGASVELAEGTALELDFDGTVELKDLVYAGRRRCGELNASNCPFIRGVGTVYVRPHGMKVIIR